MQLHLTSQEYAAMLGKQIGHSATHTILINAIKKGKSSQDAQSSLSNCINDVDEIIEWHRQQNETNHEVYDTHLATIRDSCKSVLNSCLSLLAE